MLRNVFKEAQLIIFDLDGTLYEDTSMFNHYAHELMLELDEDKKQLLGMNIKRS